MNQQHILPQLLLRSWPFPRGAGRITDKLFSTLKFKDDFTTVETTDGFRLKVMPNELIGRHLYLTGEFDRTTSELLIANARPGDALIDIGANIGYVSARFLNNVPDTSVVAVEPQPVVVDLLRSNLAQFGTRAEVGAVGLSDIKGELPFVVDDRNRGGSHIAKDGEKANAVVKVKAASDFFAQLERADLIKIDVEGFEERVIRSASTHIARLRPRMILFENHGGTDCDAISSALPGYDIFGIRKGLTSVSLEGGYRATNDFAAKLRA